MTTSLHELGVSVAPQKQSGKETLKCTNPKLTSMREAVLCTVLGESRAWDDRTLQCLDAIAATGIAGLQWKKHLGTAVHVIAADTETDDIELTCKLNNITASDWVLNDHTMGEPPARQTADEIHICREKATVVLQKEAFDFVYLHSNGTLAMYLDSLFSNIRHTGVVCVASPDISSQCFRSPQLIQRLYHAHVMKTDYVREMAIRVVIGSMARSAARHGRGINVLYTLCHADACLIAVRVSRGSRPAEMSVTHTRMVLHCRLCEERVVYPDTHAPIESPYQLLACKCHETSPGKTAVNLGPMWCGSIFSVPYLERTLLPLVREKFPKGKLLPLLDTVVSEARCDSSVSAANQEQEKSEGIDVKLIEKKDLVADSEMADQEQANASKSKFADKEQDMVVDNSMANQKPGIHTGSKIANQEKADSTNDKQEAVSSDLIGSLQPCDNDEPIAKRLKTDDSNMTNQTHSSTLSTNPEPIRMDDTNNSSNEVTCSRDGEQNMSGDNCEEAPLFYHNLHRKKFKGIVLPKSNKLVILLRSAGYRASRTHFDPNAIRTNATSRQILQAIKGEL